MKPPATVLRRYGLSDPVHVAETTIANVWKVERDGSTPAALKVYKNNDPKGEETGFRLMQALNARGGAKIYHFDHSVAVLEWLDGPSLGELSRNNRDDAASTELIRVADLMHAAQPVVSLPTLRNNFDTLMTVKIDTAWPARTKHDIATARQIAGQLLETQTNMRALHGDLHHDNIKESSRGYLAFDAKGVFGDRAYELANAFQNPVGAPDLVADPARALRLARVWGQHWQIPPKRLLSWAAAHCALSITWAGNFDQKARTDLLAMFLGLIAES
jgi:streptomycin 6-kinase